MNCVFCDIVAGLSPCWKIYEDEKVLGILNINPVSKYHALVLPKTHAVNIFDVAEADLEAVWRAVRKISLQYRAVLGIEHLQTITNSGRLAQQTVMHLHVHLVPRQLNDGLAIHWVTHPEWREDFPRWQEDLGWEGG